MTAALAPDKIMAARTALAKASYAEGRVRMAESNLAGAEWLVATNNGVYAVGPDSVTLVLHGWFFGLHRHADHIYLFENCALRDVSVAMGRVVRLSLHDGHLRDPVVLVTGMSNKCHQLAVIDNVLCVIDTGYQCIRRFHLDGTRLADIMPFPVALPDDSSGAYLHLNSIAAIGDRIGLLLHNGKAVPQRPSEVAWFDRQWALIERHSIIGHSCHDIVADANGAIWHCDSMAGDIISDHGHRIPVTDQMMTRGLAFRQDRVLVGASRFGPRRVRDQLRGEIALLDAQFKVIGRRDLDGPPTAIIAL
jgi:hypothetical protein